MGALPNPRLKPFWELTPGQKLVMMALGAAAFGGIVYGVTGRLRKPRGLTPAGLPQCDVVVPGSGGNVAGLRYLERVTPGTDPDARLPMIVVLHSKGSRPEHYAGTFYRHVGQPVRLIVPEGPLELGQNREWFRLPGRTKKQAELADQMLEASATLATFLTDITRCRPTVGRPVVTGSSQGGSMTYAIATLYPYLVRGAVALAGWLPAELWSPYMVQTVGLHGTKDTAVPFAKTAQYAAAMQERGAPFTFETYDTGHAINRAMQRDWRESVSGMLGA